MNLDVFLMLTILFPSIIFLINNFHVPFALSYLVHLCKSSSLRHCQSDRWRSLHLTPTFLGSIVNLSSFFRPHLEEETDIQEEMEEKALSLFVAALIYFVH